jgi:site-specific DNA-methyltransferase (adenine-specific)
MPAEPSVRLMLGDCLERMAEVEAGSVDMVLADLPYGITEARFDVVIPFEPLWSHYRRVLKPRGIIALTAGQPFTSMLVMSNPGWFRHEWVWIKNRGSNFANTVREPMKEHESVLIFSPGRWTYHKQMQERTGGGASRVEYGFTFDSDSENYRAFPRVEVDSLPRMRVPSSWQKFNTEVGQHPQQKPVALGRYLVRTYTDPGEVVLDNACGSGSFGVAAVEEGRSFLGIEKDPTYFAVAERRIAAARPAMPLFAPGA